MFRIAALIARLQWSQHDMADHLGVAQASVSRMVKGQAETGPVERLLDLLAIERGWPDLTASAFAASQSAPVMGAVA